jgi:hypothetical protein
MRNNDTERNCNCNFWESAEEPGGNGGNQFFWF